MPMRARVTGCEGVSPDYVVRLCISLRYEDLGHCISWVLAQRHTPMSGDCLLTPEVDKSRFRWMLWNFFVVA